MGGPQGVVLLHLMGLVLEILHSIQVKQCVDNLTVHHDLMMTLVGHERTC